jgi:molecular chaperone DnaK (HSP70)
MKRQAESYLGVKNLTNVVVTIPVYFSKIQIAATILSCQMAGLNVLRTIKESQAIALGIYH